MRNSPIRHKIWQTLLIVFFTIGCTMYGVENQPNLNVNNIDLSGRALLSQADLDSTNMAEKEVKNGGNNGNNGNNGNGSSPNSGGIATASLSTINYAPQATVSAESTYPGYSVSKINDGSTNTTVGPSYSWANNFSAGGKLPESVFLKFSSLKTVNKIDIYTSSGYALQNYTIKYRTTSTGSWVNLATVTGNTSVHRSHSFASIALLEVQITCELGPAIQTIYGRLNEVQIWGEVGPTLPSISYYNGMLSFNSEDDVNQAIEYLEYQYDQYTDAFYNQYPGKTTLELADLEGTTGWNDDQPYINFENMYGINSLRKKISDDEEVWLAAGNAPGDLGDPDDTYMDDDELRALVNSNGEVKVGAYYYVFLSDGSYYKYLPKPGLDPLEPLAMLSTLRNLKKGQPLPANVEHKGGPITNIALTCKLHDSDHGFEYNGAHDWRYKWKVKYGSDVFGINGHLKAYTKSFQYVRGRWRKRGAHIEAYAAGTLVYTDCSGGGPVATPVEVKNHARKVKAKISYAAGSKGKSGAIHSEHYSDMVNFSTHTLSW